MGATVVSLGKGLREPCSPFRTTTVFGADLNTPNADGWNCPAEIVDPTTTFDLRSLTPEHEVCVCLVVVTNATAGANTVNISFRRKIDSKGLFWYPWQFNSQAGGWFYVYAYIGFVDWEIIQDGDYAVDVWITGANPYSGTIDFTVTGITVVVQPPAIPPADTNAFITAFNSISSFFYDMYLTANDWVWPFYLIAAPLYSLSNLATDASWAFYNLGEWISAVSDSVQNILNWDTLREMIRSWLPGIEDVLAWFYDRANEIQALITSWWSNIYPQIQEYVNLVVAPFEDMLSTWGTFWGLIWPTWTGIVSDIAVQVTSFFNETLPDLVDFSTLGDWWTGILDDVTGLVDSAFAVRETLWSGWSDFRDQVAELFDDPEAWLLDKIESMLDRFW